MSRNSEKENIFLPEGDNTFSSFGRSARIFAGSGNDTISVGGGDYEVYADGGNNTIANDSGHAQIYTGAGDDQLISRGTAFTTFYAGDGNNRLDSSTVYEVTFYAGSGNDVVRGSVGLGGFFIDAGGGDNDIVASGGFRSASVGVRTQAGNDVIFAQSPFNAIQAGEGDNTITSYASLGTLIQTGSGGDRIEIGVSGGTTQPGSVTINAGDGKNKITGWVYGTTQVFLGQDDDTVNLGLPLKDSKIDAGAGNNRITVNAPGGKTEIYTRGVGKNQIQLLGEDIQGLISTESGDDEIRVSSGTATVSAGEGKNYINGVGASLVVYAGSGNDGMDLSSDNVVYAGEGNNAIFAGGQNNQVYTGAGDDLITLSGGVNVVYAGEGNNQITTGSGDDLIGAGAGNDRIFAGAGNNRIEAGDGNNTIISLGNDVILTGRGSDRFVLSPGDGVAQIQNFDVSDRFVLGSLTFGDLSITAIGNDAQISMTATQDVLAIVQGVQANTLDGRFFV
ncbi:MAG: hypothetical protein MUF49_16760 [Oculatellaceae cyanobacterium Prado106]|jgi:Ca2+-binding RTX toxin-like protein|nr:hypothetical protein [Oculatellaceae cyanobacterium Prado106]